MTNIINIKVKGIQKFITDKTEANAGQKHENKQKTAGNRQTSVICFKHTNGNVNYNVDEIFTDAENCTEWHIHRGDQRDGDENYY